MSLPQPLKSIKALWAAASLALACAAPAAMAAYPEQPIRIIVPYTAGGSSDVIARAISDELTAELGQSVIVENRAGAGSMIGTAYVAAEKPDGYTLLLADVPFTIVPALYGERVKYDAAKDFAPISLLGLSPMYLFVTPAFKAKSVADLVEMAKAKPGSISIGSGGNGSLTHLMAELLMLNTGIKLVHIPYKGASAAANDLAGGQIETSFTTMPTASALYQGGKIRPLAVSSPQRQADTPDVPTFEEAGVPNMTVQSWWGLVAPAKTPAPVLARLNTAMEKVMQSPKVKSRLNGVGVNVPADTSAKALQALLTADFARWQDVVKRAGVKFE
ncbi:Bug family tripartite tricarboxylate transporter substrate binding protein [Achromobacter aloeverae]